MNEEIKNEEEKKAPRRRKSAKAEAEIEAGESCARTHVKNVWVVGVAVIVLVSIFCIALFNNPKPSTTLSQPMPLNAQGVAMEGFTMPMPQYQMDPILQQIAPQPVAFGTYGPACPPNGRYQPAMMTPVAMAGAHAGPPIFRDAMMLHQFRGVCENCHIVSPDIPIPPSAQMVHEYRGVCSNCHVILGVTDTAGVQ